MELKEGFKKISLLSENLSKVIKGKQGVIDLAITALIARGHLLIEDVPGVGKTTLAHGLAKSINCTFQRIQFTSDLLPSDVIGVTVYNQSEHRFEFRPGPLFANIVLADEINRATPKTQSSLLEAMNDRQVSVDRKTWALPSPFMLLATQNPIEYAGTFPLPESQLDRFMMCLKMGYPAQEHERAIIRSTGHNMMESMGPVLTTEDVSGLQFLTQKIRVDDDIVSYILEIAAATRAHKGIRLGASPRATKTMYMAIRALALASGRDYCIPDDVKRLAVPVLAHRIIPADRIGDDAIETSSALVEEIISSTEVPV